MHIDIKRVASGFIFTEGPVWHPDNYLLFSDIPANKIWKLRKDGETELFRDNSGFTGTETSSLSDMIGSNGLAIDRSGDLIICQHGDHAIAKLDKEGKISVITGSYNNRPFNSPNDIVIRSDGSIFFTDPPYGLKGQVLIPEKFQPHGGIYMYNRGASTLIATELRYPNGVCFSPGEKFLYAGSNHPDEPLLLRYSLNPDGSIIERVVIAKQNADGITVDKTGNLFLCTDNGIVILSPAGEKLHEIALPETPSNLAWKTVDSLYVTARTGVYHLRIKV
jgi:gluconolactonase